MASLLDTVDARTQLVGENRLELLMFRLTGSQVFAINVFKVQEVQRMPKLNMLPKRHYIVTGVTHVRGQTIPVIDLSKAIGLPEVEDPSQCNIIITEYNRSVQAFMACSVDRIVNMNWEQIQPPPKGSGRDHYLTAICQMGEEIVEIIDVEKVLAKIKNYLHEVGAVGEMDMQNNCIYRTASQLTALIVDDSRTAAQQIKSTLSIIGLNVVERSDGAKGLELLKQMADEGKIVSEEFCMVITDAEMPEMDGYRLTSEIRSDPRLRDLYVVMHTSLSGNFNQAMVEKVGCDHFISKFQPDKLAALVTDRIQQIIDEKKVANPDATHDVDV